MENKFRNDWFFLGLALLFFILGGVFGSGLLLLAGWTMIIVELFYILIITW